jgi:hypothetical protein
MSADPDRPELPEPNPAPPPAPVEAETCPICNSTALDEIRCKTICRNCRTIVRSCSDL